MGTWYNLKLIHKGKEFDCKYTALAISEKKHADCDSEGNILKAVIPENPNKKYWINEETEEKHFTRDTVYKLINGKANKGLKGRVKERETTTAEKGQSEDLLTEKEFLIDNEQLYNELNDSEIELMFKGWFGNGYKAYKVYVVPSKLYKGFCIMKCGRGNKSDIMGKIVRERNDIKDMKEKLQAIELTANKVATANVDDLLDGF